jgi:hypothetical protein
MVVAAATARRVMLVAVALLLGACAPPDLTPEGPADAGTEAGQQPDDRERGEADLREEGLPPPAGSPGAPPPAAPPAPPELVACEGDELAAMDEVIAGQLAAFADDDWEAALGFASSDVRAATDADAFALLIEEAYPAAADAVEHRSERCVTRGTGAAEVHVRVTAADGARADLVYLLVDEEGWRIAGAVAVATDGEDVTSV